jgi:methylenetetrahydrofolate reductase (NADPH)
VRAVCAITLPKNFKRSRNLGLGKIMVLKIVYKNEDNLLAIQYTEHEKRLGDGCRSPIGAHGCGRWRHSSLTFGNADMTDITTSTSVARALRGYSIEVNPNDPKVVDAALARLDPGTEVFLTWIPGANPMDVIGPAARLRRGGLLPVPHVGARHIESAAQLEQFAARLAGDAGVDRVLIIAGDRATPAGPYDSTLAVMQSEAFQKLGIIRVAVTGFPEGNPNISEAALEEALSAKLTFARTAGLEISIVTQFCFETAPIIEWLARIRARGVNVPVRVGLAGPAGLLTLARYAVRCGVGNSLRVLTEKPSFAKLLVERGPEPIIRGVACADGGTNTTPLPFGIVGLHFFVFGGFNTTVDWINAERGR